MARMRAESKKKAQLLLLNYKDEVKKIMEQIDSLKKDIYFDYVLDRRLESKIFRNGDKKYK
jgi:hypothetical protein